MDGKENKDELFEATIAKHPKTSISEFDDIWQHLEEEAIQRDNSERYMTKDLEGILWLREAFLQAQYHGPQTQYITPMMIGKMLAAMQVFMVITTQMERRDLPDETYASWYAQSSTAFWLFNIPLAFIQMSLGMVNCMFMFSVLQDFSRRAFAAERLTEMLEVDLNRKSTIGIKLCSLNFVDPASLLTWMELRRMVFDVGKRFYIRLEGNIVAFSICLIVELGLIMAKLNAILDASPFISNWHYLLMGFHLLTIGLYNFKTLWVAANINEECGNSMDKLIKLRHLAQRLCMDKRLLAEDFDSVSADIRKACAFLKQRAEQNVSDRT